MYNRVIIIPYKIGSRSAKLLKESLVEDGVRCFRKTTSDQFNPKNTDLILYYGGTDHLMYERTTTNNINRCRYIAQNKLSAFRVLKDNNIPTVEWTDSHTVALSWLEQGKLIVGRRSLTGHSGQGIELYHADDVQGDAAIGGEHECCPLFTIYMKKTYECRIHVFNGTVIDAQIKKKVKDYEGETNTYIRNHHTGWVYCREDFIPTDQCKQIAIDAVIALNLDFGAVDIIYNKYHNQYYVLEVNTAPGLEGTTLINYRKAIQRVINP